MIQVKINKKTCFGKKGDTNGDFGNLNQRWKKKRN